MSVLVRDAARPRTVLGEHVDVLAGDAGDPAALAAQVLTRQDLDQTVGAQEPPE